MADKDCYITTIMQVLHDMLSNLTRVAVTVAAAVQMSDEMAVPFVKLGKSNVTCSRILHGLWQTSGGWGKIEQASAVGMMRSLFNAGYTTFDGADHYGPAEDLMGALRSSLTEAERQKLSCFTKWCPQPGPMRAQTIETAIDRSSKRMQTKSLDLLQFHW